MNYELLIKLGGVFHVICAAFHIIFPRMFKWKEHLDSLPVPGKNVIKENLYISNICMLLFWLILACIPFFYSHEMLSTQIGKALLTCIVVLWIVRIFILHPVFSDIKSKLSIARVIFFLCGFSLFLIPWIRYCIIE